MSRAAMCGQATVERPPVLVAPLAVVSVAGFGTKPPFNFSSSLIVRVSLASTLAASPSEATLFDCGTIGGATGPIEEMLLMDWSFSWLRESLSMTTTGGFRDDAAPMMMRDFFRASRGGCWPRPMTDILKSCAGRAVGL
jgi:hypothetical protein